jgi:hypothetical protein
MALIVEVGNVPADWRLRLPLLRHLNPAAARAARRCTGVGASAISLEILPTIWAAEPLALLAQIASKGKPLRPFKAATWRQRGRLPNRHAALQGGDEVLEGVTDGALFLPGNPGKVVDAVRLPFVAYVRTLRAACDRLLDRLRGQVSLPAEDELRARIAKADYFGLDLKPWDLELHSLLALSRAASCADETGACLHVRALYEPKPSEEPVFFYLEHLQGFGSLRRAYPSEGGSAVTVEFACGYRYRLPMAYLTNWYPGWEEYQSSRILRARISGLTSEMLTLGLDKGPSFVTRTTTILEACEPTFDAFGGVEGHLRQMVEEGLARFGAFRLHPPVDSRASS